MSHHHGTNSDNFYGPGYEANIKHFQDPADYYSASFEEPIEDRLEPLTEEETETNHYREASRRFLRVLEIIDEVMSNSVDPWRSWVSISMAMSLQSTHCR